MGIGLRHRVSVGGRFAAHMARHQIIVGKIMQVQELIELLAVMPQDAHVLCSSIDEETGRIYEIDHTLLVEGKKSRNELFEPILRYDETPKETHVLIGITADF